MTRSRNRRGAALRSLRAVGDVPVAIALVFACTLAAPRAPLVYHTHPGGGHAHVHADGGLLAWRGRGEAAAHRRAPANAPDHRPAYARDRGAAGGHVHQQQLYHAAVIATAPCAAIAAPLVSCLPTYDRGAPLRTARRAVARGPPFPRSV